MSKQLDMDKPVEEDGLLDVDDLVDIDELVGIDERLDSDEEYYYNWHPTLEDVMPTTAIHAELVHYLREVLKWLFREQLCALYDNLNFYHTRNIRENPLAPDLAVIEGVSWQEVTSWTIGLTGPPPQLVIEIASKETWETDRKQKPTRYGHMGVLEYFLYYPNTPPCWQRPKRRLLGWRWDPVSQKMRRLASDRRGRIWSEQLDRWLVPDGSYLRLYDRYNQLCLTGEEAQSLRAEAEAMRAEIERRRADAETEARRVEARRAEEERRRAETLAEKLRALGVNPDEIA